MAIATWTDLQGAVTNWLSHSNFSSRYGEFATLFEAALNRKLRTHDMERSAVAFILSGTDNIYGGLSADYLENRSIYLQTSPKKTVLKPASIDIIRSQYDYSGIPKFFAILEDDIVIGPYANGDYVAILEYYAKIPSIETNNTNWLLTKYPDVYLYGMLMQCAIYDHDPENEARYEARVNKIFDDIMIDDRKAKWNSRPSIEILGSTP